MNQHKHSINVGDIVHVTSLRSKPSGIVAFAYTDSTYKVCQITAGHASEGIFSADQLEHICYTHYSDQRNRPHNWHLPHLHVQPDIAAAHQQLHLISAERTIEQAANIGKADIVLHEVAALCEYDKVALVRALAELGYAVEVQVDGSVRVQVRQK